MQNRVHLQTFLSDTLASCLSDYNVCDNVGDFRDDDDDAYRHIHTNNDGDDFYGGDIGEVGG